MSLSTFLFIDKSDKNIVLQFSELRITAVEDFVIMRFINENYFQFFNTSERELQNLVYFPSTALQILLYFRVFKVRSNENFNKKQHQHEKYFLISFKLGGGLGKTNLFSFIRPT